MLTNMPEHYCENCKTLKKLLNEIGKRILTTSTCPLCYLVHYTVFNQFYLQEAKPDQAESSDQAKLLNFV